MSMKEIFIWEEEGSGKKRKECDILSVKFKFSFLRIGFQKVAIWNGNHDMEESIFDFPKYYVEI